MKTAIITGGGGALGSALVSEFSKDYRVIFTFCENEKRAIETAKRYGTEYIRCDQKKEEDIKKLINTAGFCDLLINNAGISMTGLFSQMSEEDLCEIIDINLIGAMRVTKAVIPLMLKKKSGCIINISSIWGIYGGSCEAAYSASKAGIIGFSKALSRELGGSGIRVNSIAPGLIESEMNSHLSEKEISDFLFSTSLGRIGKPFDVAQAARYFERAEFVTGQVLGVDGGV